MPVPERRDSILPLSKRPNENADREPKALTNEANEPTEHADPIEPIEQNEPIEPMLNALPIEPMLNALPIEPIEQNELAEPIETSGSTLPVVTRGEFPLRRSEKSSSAAAVRIVPRRRSRTAATTPRTEKETAGASARRRLDLSFTLVSLQRGPASARTCARATNHRVASARMHLVTQMNDDRSLCTNSFNFD